jgi:Flp pilus assembly protein protease CpaA
MYLALVVSSIYISSFDLKFHRISNKSLVASAFFFQLLQLLQRSPVHPRSALLVLAITPFFLLIGVGAGDLKLLILLSFFFLPFSLSTLVEFLAGFTVVSVYLILQTSLKRRSLRSNIALAPAICGAVIWCARSSEDLSQYVNALAYSR